MRKFPNNMDSKPAQARLYDLGQKLKNVTDLARAIGVRPNVIRNPAVKMTEAEAKKVFEFMNGDGKTIRKWADYIDKKLEEIKSSAVSPPPSEDIPAQDVHTAPLL